MDVPAIDFKELSSDKEEESSSQLRKRIECARGLQTLRFVNDPGVVNNAFMTTGLIKKHCRLDNEGSGLLEQAMYQRHLSARAHGRILKVSRTLADLDGEEDIRANHVLEAIQYRSLDRSSYA